MLSIKRCDEILNKKNKKFTVKEIKIIRDHLYKMALIVDDLKDKEND